MHPHSISQDPYSILSGLPLDSSQDSHQNPLRIRILPGNYQPMSMPNYYQIVPEILSESLQHVHMNPFRILIKTQKTSLLEVLLSDFRIREYGPSRILIALLLRFSSESFQDSLLNAYRILNIMLPIFLSEFIQDSDQNPLSIHNRILRF